MPEPKELPWIFETRLFTVPTHFPCSSGKSTGKSQKDTDRIWLCSHNCNLRGGNPHCWKFSEYQFAVCRVNSSSLVWAGQEKIKLQSRAKYTGALGSAGIPKCSHHTSTNNSKIISVECFSLNNCYSYLHRFTSAFYIPQKCFDLLFVRPLDKYIIHQHNHPIIIQLQWPLCQLVLCANAPFQKNRFPGFCGFPHYLLNHQTIQIMDWDEPWHLTRKVTGYGVSKLINFTKADTQLHSLTSLLHWQLVLLLQPVGISLKPAKEQKVTRCSSSELLSNKNQTLNYLYFSKEEFLSAKYLGSD